MQVVHNLRRSLLPLVPNYGQRFMSSTRKPFPSIVISPNKIGANGTFAETQVSYLTPDEDTIKELDSALRKANMGVVSHFYMDPELQGTLSSSNWPHVKISDSLAMGDAAVKMVKDGSVSSIACLGVDFMAESVRSVLDMEGLHHIPVYRLSEKYIGCSLAESAEKPAYRAWLEKAKNKPNSLHVVYINTSILTKAESHALVPTIACTSSNVVKTILKAYAQIPDLTVWYGPDTYMGENLKTLFMALSNMPDHVIKDLHPDHDQASVKALLTKFEVFQQGNCVVHHMFGSQVAAQIESDYQDAFFTAHLEVPGEMFKVSSDAAALGRGVVGSTSNILDFILKKTDEELNKDSTSVSAASLPKKLSFVLGTEAGMVTPIVKKVQNLLQSHDKGEAVQVEIVFPVSSESFSVTGDSKEEDLFMVPGSGGEGCSAAGGCATCPFMKMNTLEALTDLAVNSVTKSEEDLVNFKPSRREVLIQGKSSAEIGTVPIMHMRSLSQTGELSHSLVQDILTR